MTKQQLNYRRYGEKNTKKIVLLHGYLETHAVWHETAEKLSETFDVLCPDLPGHGQSPIFGETHTVEQQAKAVANLMDELSMSPAFVVGHSMGGYVALAFAEKHPEHLTAFSLFHSHPFADAPATKEKRLREIALIQAGQKNKLIKQNISNTYAPKNRTTHQAKINETIQLALNIPPQGITAALKGMYQRPDRSQWLAQTQLPFLYVWGRHDAFVPEAVFKQIKMPKNGQTLILENSGHSGFIEESTQAIQALSSFAKKHTN